MIFLVPVAKGACTVCCILSNLIGSHFSCTHAHVGAGRSFIFFAHRKYIYIFSRQVARVTGMHLVLLCGRRVVVCASAFINWRKCSIQPILSRFN